ncbi:transposase [Streptomyces guryensis]|uniref:Transposase n=1 Tax=Streptomyces guryensis TaxID=2886947 RepID=A0A9Q3ZA74_9ACTN|nr:transposase [Streptomyces guryensis]MCD9881036.1 transposase [Streptomyces guryensis]
MSGSAGRRSRRAGAHDLLVRPGRIPAQTPHRSEPAWAKKLSDEDRRGLTALFWSNINPYGTFRLEMDKRLDVAPPIVSHPRAAASAVQFSSSAGR